MLWNGSGIALMSGGGFNPASLFSGGKAGVFYDTSNLSSLFEDRSLTPSTPASVDGLVGTRKDLSGNNQHQVAPSDAARPILRTSGGLYWLEYDNSNDNLVASVTLADAFCVFMGASALDSIASILFHDSTNTPTLGVLESGSGSAASSISVAQYNVDGTAVTGTRNTLFTAIASTLGAIPHVFEARTAALSTFTTLRTGSYPFGFAGVRRDYGLVCISEANLGTGQANLRSWFNAKIGAS